MADVPIRGRRLVKRLLASAKRNGAKPDYNGSVRGPNLLFAAGRFLFVQVPEIMILEDINISD
jgi:hypothetical protein